MSDTSGTELIGYTLGGVSVGAIIMGLVVWVVKALGGRVVQREDEDKKEIKSQQEKAAERERVISEALINIKHDMQGMRLSVDQLKQQMESRATAQDKEITELRAEVKEQLMQLEHRLRSDMQRIVNEKQSRGRTKP